MRHIPRRSLLGLSPLALCSCGKSDPYFGKTGPPSKQALIYAIASEPSSLDPAGALGGTEFYVLPALFDGLVSTDPESLEPRAALATHYEVNASLTEFTFYLRGHANPRGTRLPRPGSTAEPASWSDGHPVLAQDFVFAWRRMVDPSAANAYASSFYPVANAYEISQGKSRPESLGVQADGDFLLRVSLRRPAAHFLKLIGMPQFAPVPRHVVQGTGPSWAQPGRMVSSGPFLLHEWKPYERIVLRRNPWYFDASRVRLEEIRFLPVSDGATSVNLYKTGDAHAMHGRAVPPLWIPALRGRKDFQTTAALRSLFHAFNTTRPPFDNRLLRYACHMATNKREIVRWLDGGQTTASGVIPSFRGYQGIQSLPVVVGDGDYDVLSYNPAAARQLLVLAGVSKLAFDLTFPNRPKSKEIAQILQQQWRNNLGAEVRLVMLEWNAWNQTALSFDYSGVIESGIGAEYADPNTFFELFTGGYDGSGWSDSEFKRMVDAANATGDPAGRMARLANCEERLLREMPVLPLLFDSHSYLQKPYVHGMTPNALDIPQFRTAWIDTNWSRAHDDTGN